jgi:four helix bundle protein
MTESRNLGISESRNVKPFARTFYDLDVYKKSFDISLIVHRTSLGFPKIEQYALGDQIRRSSKGICANIAEGFAKQQASKAEFRRFLLMALGSAHEMRVWTDYCSELQYITPEMAQQWIAEYESVSKMLQALVSKLQ